MQKKQVKKPTTAKKRPTRPQRRNATEVLYAFTGWLTTRKSPIIFSSDHGCAPIAEIVHAFVKANRLPKMRDNVPKMRNPLNVDHITNEQRLTATCAAPPQRPEVVIKSIMRMLYELDKVGQETVIADVLGKMRQLRQVRLDHAEKMQRGQDIDTREAQQEFDRLERIIRGDVATVYLRSNLNDTTND